MKAGFLFIEPDSVMCFFVGHGERRMEERRRRDEEKFIMAHGLDFKLGTPCSEPRASFPNHR